MGNFIKGSLKKNKFSKLMNIGCAGAFKTVQLSNRNPHFKSSKERKINAYVQARGM